MAQSFWDSSKALYRDAKGKEIPYQTVRQSIIAVTDDTKAKLRALTILRNEGTITLQSWTTQTEPLLKKLYGSVAQIAAGGRQQMTASLNGQLGANVRFHLSKFKQFWLQIEQGKLSDAQILARVEMYADSAVGIFEATRQKVMLDAGYTEARNILGEAQHCGECPALSARGWILIEEMPPVGTRACLSRDRCSVEYR